MLVDRARPRSIPFRARWIDGAQSWWLRSKAWLVQRAADIDWAWFRGVGRLGITAGAFGAGVLVQESSRPCGTLLVTIEELAVIEESVHFRLQGRSPPDRFLEG